MIDYSFYRKIGAEGVKDVANSGLHPDDLLQRLEQSRSDLPYVDQIETTNNCNLRCVMCPRTLHMTREIINSMRMDLFTRIVDELEEYEQEKSARGLGKADYMKNGPSNLQWEGSEHDIFDLRLHHFGAPLLDPHIVERVQYVNEKASFGTQLSETVINLKIEKVRGLFQANLSRLIIAIDATNADAFLQIRGRKMDFDREIERVQRIVDLKRQEGASTRVDIQVIELSDVDAEEFSRIWGKHEGVRILKKSFFPYPDVDPNMGKQGESDFSGSCDFPYTSITVMADGRVVPCCADYNGETVLGDLNVQSLHQIWHGDAFKAFREKFVKASFEPNDLCARCGHYPFKA